MRRRTEPLDTMCAKTVTGAMLPTNTFWSASTTFSKRFLHLSVKHIIVTSSQCGEEKMDREEWMDLAVTAKMQVTPPLINLWVNNLKFC